MREFGWALLVGGIAFMAFGFFSDISTSSYGTSSEVANMSLMHRATLLTMIGGFLFVGGATIVVSQPPAS